MNREKFHAKGLRYYCNQTIDDFQKSDKGLFCSLCNKNIIDFREKTKSEYEELVINNKGGCGIFYADQIGDETTIEINWKKPLIVISFYFAFLFSNSVYAQSSTKSIIELSNSTRLNNNDTSSVKNDSDNFTKITHANFSSNGKINSCLKPKRRFYISGRFPFIHYDRRRYQLGGVLYW